MSVPPGFSLAAEQARKFQVQLDTFGIPATLHPRDGSADVDITGIIKPPAIDEDYAPAGQQGVSVIRLWVWFAQIEPSPQKGDKVTIAAVDYDLFDVAVDVGGAAVLKLRRRNA